VDPANAFNLRQCQLLTGALATMDQAVGTLAQDLPWDLVAQDLHEARWALHQVYEQPDRQAVVDAIFRNFCVGK